MTSTNKTKMMKKITLILILGITLIQAKAQQSVSVQITDESKLPLSEIAVSLVQEAGTTITTNLTGKDGKALFTINNPGNYFITATAAGMEKYKSKLLEIKSVTAIIDLGSVMMMKKVISNAAVTVTSKKKFIEILADKTVLNIEGNLTAEGNSAFELLKKAPGVTADKDENLKLKGSVATIYIDGKPAYLSGEQLVQYLKNMQSDAISKIEIIGNPGSKYDAAGSNGIINIRLRKNKMFGTNGTVTVGGGYGKYPKLNSRLSLNHRTKDLNIFSDLSKGYSESFNRLTYNSVIVNGATTTYQDRSNYWHPVAHFLSYKIGADYNVSKNTILGFLVKGSDDKTDAKTDNETIFKNAALQPTQSILTVSYTHLTLPTT